MGELWRPLGGPGMDFLRFYWISGSKLCPFGSPFPANSQIGGTKNGEYVFLGVDIRGILLLFAFALFLKENQRWLERHYVAKTL